MKSWDIVIFLAVGLPTLILLLHLLFRASPTYFFRQLRQVWKQGSVLGGKIEDENPLSTVSGQEVRRMAKQRLRASQVDIFAKVCKIICFILLPWTIYMLFAIALGWPRAYNVLWDIVWVFVYGFCTTVVVFPTFLTPRLMDCFYFLIMLSIVTVVSPYATSKDNFVAPLLSTNSGTIFFTFVSRSIWKTFLPCFVFGLSASSTLWVHADECLNEPRLYAVYQVLIIPTISVVAAVWGRSVEDAMCETLQNAEAKELYKAACAILRSCCDVVIELDCKGNVVRESSALSGFLLKPGQAISNFLDHIADDDERAQFLDRLTTSRLLHIGLAENMQISLKDGDNNVLRLEALWFQYRRVDGQVVYMMGLRDFSDNVGIRSARSSTPQVPVDPAALVRESAASTSFEETYLPAVQENFSVPETGSVGSDSVGEPAATVCIDTTKVGMPIVGVSPGFRSRIGRLPADGKLADHVSKPSEFENWVCESVNYLCYNLPAREHHVRLRMPYGEMSAICKVVPGQSNTTGESEEESDLETVSIQFHRIKRRKKGETREHPLPPPTFWGTPPSPLTRITI